MSAHTPLLLSIDLGTAGSKATLFDSRLREVSSSFKEHTLIARKVGWAEELPEEWWKNTAKAIHETIRKAGVSPTKIMGIGLTGHHMSLVFLSKDDKVLKPAILWIDRRAHSQCERIKQTLGEESFYQVTGVKVDPTFSPFKLLWVKENEPHVFERADRIMWSRDYILYKLTGSVATDYTYVSASGLLDTRKMSYAEEALGKLGITIDKFPKILSPTTIIGEVGSEAARLTGLAQGTPVVLGSGDASSSMIGTGAVTPGSSILRISTSSDVMVCVEGVVLDSKRRTCCYAHAIKGLWMLIAGNICGGLTYRWFRDNFCEREVETAAKMGIGPYRVMDSEAGDVEAGSKNLIFMPYIMGEMSPVWNPNARGVFFGIHLTHKKAHFLRAILEGVGYHVAERVEIIEKELGIPIENVRASERGTISKTWMQVISDILGKPVSVLKVKDSGIVGAAIIAGVAFGLCKDIKSASQKSVSVTHIYKPRSKYHEKYSEGFKIYKALYKRLSDLFPHQ